MLIFLFVLLLLSGLLYSGSRVRKLDREIGRYVRQVRPLIPEGHACPIDGWASEFAYLYAAEIEKLSRLGYQDLDAYIRKRICKHASQVLSGTAAKNL